MSLQILLIIESLSLSHNLHTMNHTHTHKHRKKRKSDSFEDGDSAMTFGDRLREFLQNLRYFRIFIALWNIVIIVCMFM